MSSAESSPVLPVIDSYLESAAVRNRLPALSRLAVEIALNASPGTNDLDLEGITAVPVAAHQDSQLVWNTLKGHVSSFGSDLEPRTQVILSLNAPRGAAKAPIDATTDAVRTFISENPDFPLSYYGISYKQGTPIGTIRSDLTDSSLCWTSQVGGRIAPQRKDISLLVNDIDEVSREAGYESNMLDTLAESGVIGVRGLIAFNESGYPNIDRLLRWYAVPAKAGVSSFEANYGLSIRDAYIPAKGYDRKATNVETAAVALRAPSYKTGYEPIKTAPGSLIVTSNRHLLAAALNGIAPWDVDTNMGVSSVPWRLPEHIQEVTSAGSDVSGDDYNSWTLSFQRDVLRYGGTIAYRRKGPDALRLLAATVEDARRELGGGEFEAGEAAQIMSEVVANTETLFRPEA